ncbi:hypothetical protein SLE2022_305550 [Rubroshorea leprosula]
MGRRKIEMKMVKDSSSRQVTFSKRRTGLFKKANELATLCAAQVVIVVFSPGGKPFSFGHPTVEEVVERFLNQGTPTKPSIPNLLRDSPQDKRDIKKLNHQLSKLLKELEAEKQKGEMLEKEMTKVKGAENFRKPISDLSLLELLDLKKFMEGLQEKLWSRADEMEVSSSLLLLSQNPVSNKAEN